MAFSFKNLFVAGLLATCLTGSASAIPETALTYDEAKDILFSPYSGRVMEKTCHFFDETQTYLKNDVAFLESFFQSIVGSKDLCSIVEKTAQRIVNAYNRFQEERPCILQAATANQPLRNLLKYTDLRKADGTKSPEVDPGIFRSMLADLHAEVTFSPEGVLSLKNVPCTYQETPLRHKDIFSTRAYEGHKGTVYKNLLLFLSLTASDAPNFDTFMKQFYAAAMGVNTQFYYLISLENAKDCKGLFEMGQSLSMQPVTGSPLSIFIFPNVGFVWGGNLINGQALGLDASSFVSTVTNVPFRMWTGAMVMAARKQTAEDEGTSQMIKGIQDHFTFPTVDEAQAGDLILWNGMISVFVDWADVTPGAEHVWVVEANRADDQSIEGILFRSRPLNKNGDLPFFLRRSFEASAEKTSEHTDL